MEVSKWTGGLRQLYEDTKAAMDDLFNHASITLTIPDIVEDDMTERRRGYSWLDNGTFVQDRALMKILMDDEDLHLCVKGPGGLIFNGSAMMKVMGKMAAINTNLSILCHELPGQPARASEFIEHKIRNSVRGRTFFRQHGADWLITRRVKSEYKSHHEAFLPSKIPPELQQLLDLYLLCVCPVETDFARRLWGDEVAILYHEYLFVQYDIRMTEDQFSRNLARISREYFGCELGVRNYRHIAVEIARVYLGSEYEILMEDGEEEGDAIAEQAGHGLGTRRRIYAPEIGMLPGVSSDLLLRFGHVSEWWWRLTGFHPKHPRLLPLQNRRQIHQEIAPQFPCHSDQESNAVVNSGFPMEKMTALITNQLSLMKAELQKEIQSSVAAGIAEVLQRQQFNHILSLPPVVEPNQQMQLDQPTNFVCHPTSVAKTSYQQTSIVSLPAVAEPDQTMQPEQPNLHISSTSDALSGHSGDLSVAASANDFLSTDDDGDLYMVPPAQPHEPTTVDIPLQLLKRLFPHPNDIDFKSPQQRQIVEEALARQRNFLGILPTGGGKSLAFLLPVLHEEEGVTVVVIPNRSLLNDMLDRCQKLKVPVCRWTATHNGIWAEKLVLLAVESIVSSSFRMYVSLFQC